MRRFIVALFALLLAAPASAQVLSIDVNGDGRTDGSDVLGPGVTSVDIYLDTQHDATGKAAVCAGGEPFTVSSYTFILEWEPVGTATLTYGAWSDNMGFTVNAGGMQAGRMFWTGRAAPFYLAPGRYKLGSLAVKVTGTPVLRFLSWTPADVTAQTSFGSQCEGREFDNTIRLGADFVDGQGTSVADDAPRTVWRTIQDLYR